MELHLTDLKNLTKAEHVALWTKIAECPPDKVLPLGPCRLPAGCSPTHIDIGFFKDGPYFCMKVRPSFSYTGDNWAIRLISSGETVPFCNYPEMAMFFREFPSTDANPTPTRRATAPSHSYDLDSVANMGAIKVPAAAPVEAAPPPDAKTLREELGKIIIGQDTAVATIAHHVALHVNKKNPQKP
ncbi:hypothetical protein, partial [Bacteroides sp. UBA939]|uniref:hypothetical protein n=1 Tax=Bacteroides sp. UBA939 TaxID=1946092 RepID=UPI0025C23BB2